MSKLGDPYGDLFEGASYIVIPTEVETLSKILIMHFTYYGLDY
jgi:hypothetical protein